MGFPDHGRQKKDASASFHEILRACQASLSGADGTSCPRVHLALDAPVDPLRGVPPGTSPQEILSRLDEAYRHISLHSFLHLATQEDGGASTLGDLDRSLAEHPPTLCVFPGIFSEFIETMAFHEMFSRDSSAHRREWEEALAVYRRVHCPQEVETTLHDSCFSLDTVSREAPESARVPRRLDELLVVSSLDGEDGRPLVRGVLFRHDPLSLETVGDPGDIARILMRRLKAYFAVMGVPADLVFVGYSLGALVALDLVAQAHGEHEAWLSSLRAIVSLGGVLYGSHLADDALGEGASGQGLIPLLRRLVDQLRETAGLPLLGRGRTKLATFARNLTAWAGFVRGVRRLEGKPGARTLLKVALGVDLAPVIRLFARFETRTLPVLNPFRYSRNILRFNTLARRAISGLESLGTRACLRWWAYHTLPTTCRYYALNATFWDPEDTGNAAMPAAALSAHDPRSADETILLDSYRRYRDLSGISLNDSQVSVNRSCFWPALTKAGRRAQLPGDLDTRWLGTCLVHHWGLVFPSVEGGRPNPFPRTALFKALAAQVALDSHPATGALRTIS